MAQPDQIIGLAKIRPVTSTTQGLIAGTVAGVAGYGIGIAYGAGTGYVRFLDVGWSIFDAAGSASLEGTGFIARIAAINGIYPPGARNFQWNTDLASTFGTAVMFDHLIQGKASYRKRSLWAAPRVTDEGEPLTVLMSQLYWPVGAPGVIIAQMTLDVGCDYAHKFRGGPPYER